MAQSAPATAQTIEAYVGETMDAARMGPVHWQVLALVLLRMSEDDIGVQQVL